MSVHQRTIVVTGASSGIGRATALHLDELGFTVFAGVRKEEDGRALMEASSDKSAYAASKFAVQAISDALRVELRPFEVSVSCLAVGKIDTAVLDKIITDRQAMIGAADPEIVSLYKPLIEFFDREVKDLPGIPPLEAGRVVAKILMSARPKAHYLVGPGARKMKNLAHLPVRLRDMLLFKAIYAGRLS